MIGPATTYLLRSGFCFVGKTKPKVATAVDCNSGQLTTYTDT